MNQLPKDIKPVNGALNTAKFQDPRTTLSGQARAFVGLDQLETLWINTGTLCNIECKNCYILSSPTNDQLVYFKAGEALRLFDEIEMLSLGTREIGFTGGEPFMNPELPTMVEAALERGWAVLILTNAMQPMQRKKSKAMLCDLNARFGDKLTLRISLDHYDRAHHEDERGPLTFDKTIEGIDWLAAQGIKFSLAGRTRWNEVESDERAGFADLIKNRGWPVDASNPGELVLFPEMDETVDVPEITTQCWTILGKRPSDVMCASSRMVVHRKGADAPAVVPCTLIAHEEKFEMGETLKQAMAADSGNFSSGQVSLNHPHCAKFCVLGGGRCTA